MVDLNPLHLFKRNQDEYEKALLGGIANTFAHTSTQPSGHDDEMRRGLDIDIHMIEDEGLIRFLDNLCEGIKYTTKVYDNNGKLLVRDIIKDGVIVNCIPVTEEKVHVFPWAPALRVAMSKVFSTRYIAEYDAETDKIKLRNEFAKIKRNMTPSERRLFTPYINMILLFCETSLDDAKNGNKALCLKVQRKDLTVGLSRKTIKGS